jgi:hypothetical protein
MRAPPGEMSRSQLAGDCSSKVADMLFIRKVTTHTRRVERPVDFLSVWEEKAVP